MASDEGSSSGVVDGHLDHDEDQLYCNCIPPVSADMSDNAEAMADVGMLDVEELVIYPSKKWSNSDFPLSVGFIDSPAPSAALQSKILSFMNEWSKYTAASFVLVNGAATSATVRITLTGVGYWSNLGRDVLRVPRDRPTMCLSGFSLNTSDKEYMRVVPHETGHTLAFPHEQLRPDLVGRIDTAKAIAYFQRTQGWDEAKTRGNVLTPLDPSTVRMTTQADTVSIMCYQLPKEIMRDGYDGFPGGVVIDALDQAFAASEYPNPAGNDVFLSDIQVYATNNAMDVNGPPPAGQIRGPDDRPRFITELTGQNTDINAGFGGKFVYLIAHTTRSAAEAVRDIAFSRSGNPNPGLADLAQGAGGDYRYLILGRASGLPPIKSASVFLWRQGSKPSSNVPPGFNRATIDLNQGRGGDYLYVCWRN